MHYIQELKKGITYAAIALLLAIVMFNYSCRPEELEHRDNFDRNQMLQDIADQHISPDINAFKQSSQDLNTAVSTFSTTPTLANLSALQDQFISTALQWENCSSYNLGDVMNALIFSRIEYRPSTTSYIEDYIAGSQTLDNAFIESLGPTSKGLAAIEYLIFNENGDNAVVLDSLTSNSRRMNYVVATTENLYDQAILLETTWNGYYPTFIQYEGNNVGGSVSELMSEMSNVLEAVYAQRLGFPLGKNDLTNTGQPEDVETPLTGQSLEFIKRDVAGVEEAFFNDGTNLLGFDDYLNALGAKYNGEPLPDVVRAQFAVVNDALDAIPGTLEDAVVNNYDLVETAYLEMKELVVLMKVDVASQLSITITFNDNDGD